MLLSQLNSIPLVLYNYDTTQSMASFLVAVIVGFVFVSILTGGIVSMTGAAGAWAAGTWWAAGAAASDAG